jgi:hypothetical protein
MCGCVSLRDFSCLLLLFYWMSIMFEKCTLSVSVNKFINFRILDFSSILAFLNILIIKN